MPEVGRELEAFSDWELAHADALRDALSRRDVPMVGEFARDPVVRRLAGSDEGVRVLVERALAWLPVAEAHEAIHGVRSLVDRSDPVWRLMESAREALRRQGTGLRILESRTDFDSFGCQSRDATC